MIRVMFFLSVLMRSGFLSGLIAVSSFTSLPLEASINYSSNTSAKQTKITSWKKGNKRELDRTRLDEYIASAISTGETFSLNVNAIGTSKAMLISPRNL